MAFSRNISKELVQLFFSCAEPPSSHQVELLVVEQRLPLPISRFWRHDTLEEDVAVRVDHRRHVERAHEEDGENDKGEDPLQGNDLDMELLHREGLTGVSSRALCTLACKKYYLQRVRKLKA